MKQNEGNQKIYTKEKTISNWMLKRRKCSFNIYEKRKFLLILLAPWKLQSANSLVLFKLIKKLCNFVFLSHCVLFFVLFFCSWNDTTFQCSFHCWFAMLCMRKNHLRFVKSFLAQFHIIFHTKRKKERKK